ncbi:hypothetical protein I6F26_30775 [Ensifer sp. IC3342]|nr:hypothetical protein [Ensifer sp. BRP08]MCA1450891.1 hypothetical protein [Ensifer sp. IC3342]
MQAAVLIFVLSIPLEAAVVLLWFGPLNAEQIRPPTLSSIWAFEPKT